MFRDHFFSRFFNWFIIVNRISTFILRFNEFIAWNVFLRLFAILLFRNFFSSCNIDVFRNHFLSWFFNWFVIVNSISTFIFRFNEFITRNIFLRLFTIFLFRNFFSGCNIDVFRNHHSSIRNINRNILTAWFYRWRRRRCFWFDRFLFFKDVQINSLRFTKQLIRVACFLIDLDISSRFRLIPSCKKMICKSSTI